MKWERGREQVHSLHLSESDPKAFVITLLDSYKFETDSVEQVQQIAETFRQLGLGEVVYEQQLQGEEDDGDGGAGGAMPAPAPVDVGDEGEYVAAAANPLAQFRLERPPRFPQVPASHERLMKPQNFELVASVGRGSFGQVFLVRRVDDNRFFAMKVLKKRAIIDRKQLLHLRAEHTILQAIRHPYTVRLYHSFQTRTRLFLIMDFAIGGEMFHQLKKVGHFPESLAVFYLAEIVSAFEHLHGYDVVFRDTKPENILLDAHGHVMLADFGLAKCGVSADSTNSSGMSTTTFCGTPDYLSTEVVAGVPHGKAVDVWSIGALLFEMLVGQAPFSFGSGGQSNRAELYRRILRGVIAFPPIVSDEARSFIMWCMQRRPKDRPLASELRGHPLFAKNGIDWERLAQRKLPPPHRMKIDDACVRAVEGRLVQGHVDNIYRYVLPDSLVAHFDPRFTREPPTLAPSTPQDAVTAEEDACFREFCWTAPYAFDRQRAV